MTIDPGTGAIVFPNGFAVDANLTQTAFREGPVFAQARADEAGVPPWVHFQFPVGELEGRPVLADLLFYEEMLVTVTVAVDLYPPGPKDWANYSLDVEAATKDLHDGLLRRLLGGPTELPALPAGQFPPTQSALARPHVWRLAWGSVWSGHDTRGGGTSVMVHYGDRREEANRAFRSRSQ